MLFDARKRTLQQWSVKFSDEIDTAPSIGFLSQVFVGDEVDYLMDRIFGVFMRVIIDESVSL
jgi:hypothetical protein